MSATDGVRFGTLHEDGTVTDERTVPVAAIRGCPFLILAAEHYRADGSGCRCTDPSHAAMREWGYSWSLRAGRWV